jgi:hypothetical protein
MMSETIKVKKLRWKRHHARSGDWQALSCVGFYEIGWVHFAHATLLRTIDKDAQTVDLVVARTGTAAEAKAAAQADYERRILAALDGATTEAARRAKRNAEIAERY